MKRIHGLVAGLAVGLLFCACGAGDEGPISVGDPAASEDRASEQAEAAQSTSDLDADGQTAAVVVPTSCTTACTKVSTSNLTGSCCICNGVQKTFVRSVVNRNVYLCL
jgi:hypothetical protein